MVRFMIFCLFHAKSVPKFVKRGNAHSLYRTEKSNSSKQPLPQFTKLTGSTSRIYIWSLILRKISFGKCCTIINTAGCSRKPKNSSLIPVDLGMMCWFSSGPLLLLLRSRRLIRQGSCGMDACEHEYESMSRHGRKVPVSFYHQFTRDACAFSDRFADGRIISVLEGGYSDRALISGTMAHISGLVTAHNHNMDDKVNRTWWDVDNLAKVSPICRHVDHVTNCITSLDSWKRRLNSVKAPGVENLCRTRKPQKSGCSVQ